MSKDDMYFNLINILYEHLEDHAQINIKWNGFFIFVLIFFCFFIEVDSKD